MPARVQASVEIDRKGTIISVKLPNGSIVSIASGYGLAKAITALTNATEAVATLVASSGFATGDLVEVTSGWSKLSGRIVRLKSFAADVATLEGVNTSDTTKFPAGSGIGSLRKITGWTQITQILDFAFSGGDQQFTTYSFLEDDTERQIPTVKSAAGFKVSLGDDQTLPWYPVLDAADADRLPRAIQVTLASGAQLLYNTFASFNKTPTLTKNQVMALAASFSLTADTTRYAS